MWPMLNLRVPVKDCNLGKNKLIMAKEMYKVEFFLNYWLYRNLNVVKMSGSYKVQWLSPCLLSSMKGPISPSLNMRELT